MRFLLTVRTACMCRLATAIALLTFLLVTPTTILAQQGSANSRIYPPDSQPFGMTYGDWNAAWIQYQVSIPVPINPTLDATGANCNVGQSGGPVFFLSGSYNSDPVTRTCTVPRAQAILVPLIAWECSTVEPPPSNGSTPPELRACAGGFIDGVGVHTLKLTIDGAKVTNLKRFRAQSPLFEFTFPETDNFLGLSGVTTGSSVSDGYFVMLKPLSVGNHVVHFEGATVSGPFAGIAMSVTYHLTVQ